MLKKLKQKLVWEDFKSLKGTMLYDRVIMSIALIAGYFPLAPVTTKLSGEHYTVVILTALSLLTSLSGASVGILKRFKMIHMFILGGVFDLILVLDMILYMCGILDVLPFLYSLSTITVISGCVNATCYTQLNIYVAENFKDLYSSYSVVSQVCSSVAGTVFLSITLFLSSKFGENGNLILSSVMMLISVYYQYRLYKHLKQIK